MARQLKLPVARVVLPVLDDGDKFAIAPNERLLLVDMDKLRLTKAYAQLKVRAAGWDEAARDAFVLSLFCQGPF